MSKFGVQKQLAVAMTYFILNMAAVLLGEMLMGHALPLELTNVDPHYISGSNSKIIAPSGRANIVDAILHIRDPTERPIFRTFLLCMPLPLDLRLLMGLSVLGASMLAGVPVW